MGGCRCPLFLWGWGAGVVELRDERNFRGLAALGEGGVDCGGVLGDLLAHGERGVVDG